MAEDLSSAYFAGTPNTAITLLSRRHWDVATQAEQRSESLRGGASSAGMEEIQVRFLGGRHAASRAGDNCYTAADASQQTSRAYTAYHRSTITLAEIASAQRDAESTSEAVQRAQLAGRPTGALCEARDAAARHLADLKQRRAAAIAELERVLTRILERLRNRSGKADVGRDFNAAPGTGTPLPTPPRGENMPGPPSKPAPTPPRTAPPAAPPSMNISNGTPGPSTDLTSLLAQAAKPAPAPQMPMPMQQPQMMPQMPQIAPQQPAAQPAPTAPAGSRDRKRGALDGDDLDDLLGDADDDAPGLAAAAVTAPRPAPAGSIAPAAPAVPATAGFSADNMRTDGPTSGRPGSAPAGAFAAPPTSLSGSHTAQATMAGPGTSAAPATHPAGAPMTGAPMGMPASGAGGGSGSGAKILKHPGEHLDHGDSARSAAVPGGTIARKPRD